MKTSFITALAMLASSLQASVLPVTMVKDLVARHGPDDDGDMPMAPKGAAPLKSASATAQAAGLTSLVSALTTAGLASTVDGLNDITIFAPTNAAFDAIKGTTKGLSKDALATVLKYHVVKGTAFSKDLKNGQSVMTLQGSPLKVMLMGGSVMINGAKVVKADVAIKGGVVHVIDKVLLPPN